MDYWFLCFIFSITAGLYIFFYFRAQNIAQTESQSDASTQGRQGADTNTQEPHCADISPQNHYSARASQGVDANYGVSDLASNEASDVASNGVVATSRNREVTNSNAANANAEGNMADAVVQESLRSSVADNFDSQAVTRNNLGTPANTSNNTITRTNDDRSALGLSGETNNAVPTNFVRINSYVEDISDNIYSQVCWNVYIVMVFLCCKLLKIFICFVIRKLLKYLF